ncbi:MAG: alanine--tRNA ligase [Patescibacteria group bacterium]|nr:MAG: alanine--tRNA ligase [Patescibacteria group bacterium]
MTLQELRQKYLQFWQSKSHAIIPSASLIPQNDPTTLFTSSGMQPMITYLLGEPHPEGTRIADSQKCFRAEDIDEVGDNRHTTMFEMLGNWSLGDYFKQEQLEWIWDFFINEVGLDPQRLYATVYSGDAKVGLSEDSEAISILTEIFKKHQIDAQYVSLGSVEEGAAKGIGNARIVGYHKKNWWSRSGTPDKMPTGEPGGPDSEIFYDNGTPHDPAFGTHCHLNCDCGRFLEIGNSVFMQYRKRADGTLEELPKKNIDFGGGLERILAVQEQKNDIFETSAFIEIIQKLEALSGQSYHDTQFTKHFRVIADHLKAATMLASDGVTPSNKMQGYMMRRLIRRAVSSALNLKIHTGLSENIVPIIQEMYKEQYREVTSSEIISILSDEEDKFRNTLTKALDTLWNNLGKYTGGVNYYKNQEGQCVLETGHQESIHILAEHGFNFFQSHGLPFDIFLDEMEKIIKFTLDERVELQHQFNTLLTKHQELSRTSSAGLFKGGLAEHSDITTQYHTATHLLHQALRDVLGEHVVQRGSNINAERLRFDFTNNERLSTEQIAQVETIVNEKIKAAIPVTMQQVSREEGYAAGSIGLFGEKYPDTVNVYTIGPAPTTEKLVPRDQVYSREFCGGPHVTNTSQIRGQFKIIKDEKIAKDVVRIKAQLLQN